MDYILTQHDLEQYSDLMKDHAAFLHLGLEVPELKDRAYNVYQDWNRFITGGYASPIAPLLEELKTLKKDCLIRLEAGDWIGWLNKSFVDHILEELVFFENLTNGIRPPPEEEVAQGLDWMRDHSLIVADMLDPVAVEYKETARRLAKQMQPNSDLQLMIGLTMRSTQQLDSLLGNIQRDKPPSIIHPTLLEHLRKEGHLLMETLDLLQNYQLT